MKQFTAKLALLTALFCIAASACAEPPRSTPGTERFGTPQPPQQQGPAAPDDKQGGQFITVKQMTEIYTNEYAKRSLIAGDKLVFTKPWKVENVRTVMKFFASDWVPRPVQFDKGSPEERRARDLFNALWEYTFEMENRRQMCSLISMIDGFDIARRLWKLKVCMENFEFANDKLMPLLKRYDESYNTFMADMKTLNERGRIGYGYGSGMTPTGWEIFNHSGMLSLMTQTAQAKPAFDRLVLTLDQACSVAKKATLDQLKDDLAKVSAQITAARQSHKAALKKIEKFAAFPDVMYIVNDDDDILIAAETMLEQATKMLNDLEDDGTIYGQLRYFYGIDRYGGLSQDGVTRSNTGTPVYRRKIRRGVEEMKAAYEKWAKGMNERFDNLHLKWMY